MKHRIPTDPRRIDPTGTLLDEYVVLDVETTGFNPEQDRLIEIGAIHVQNGQIIRRFDHLVNPHTPIPSHITQLTGIDNHMTSTQGDKEETIIRQLDPWVGNLPILAHNAPFDMSFLDTAWFMLTGQPVFNHFWLDTLEMARRLHPELEHHRVVDLIKFYGIGDVEEHRGLSDAIQEDQIYRMMRREVETMGADGHAD